MNHRLVVLPDANAVASAAAEFVADRCRDAVAERGSFTFAVSGGRSPWEMFSHLRRLDLPWDRVTVFQIDERVAPLHDADRNLTRLTVGVEGLPLRVVPMPVDVPDLELAAARYGRLLPTTFDLVHLGLGADGHTASLVPGDRVLDVADRRVAITSHPYEGRRRMTLTYSALAATRHTLWLVTGSDKRDALARLLRDDQGIPAARVVAPDSLILADEDAAGDERQHR